MNIAIIGTGAISPAHIEAYLNFSDRCRIVALVDIYPEKAEEKARKYGLDVEVYSDYKELLDHPKLDVVSVCTPPYTHAEIVIDFLQAEKHVLVEKPMASSLEECDAMLAAAKRHQKILSVVSQNRFRNPMMKLKRVLESGLPGKIVHAQVDSFWWRGYSYYDLWWRGTWEKEGGGCTLNHAVHHMDLFQWMMGLPVEVQAWMTNISHDNAEVEDLSIAMLRYGNGGLAQITSSVVHHGEEQQLIFQGEQARVSAPWKVKASLERENGFPIANDALEKEITALYEKLPNLSFEGHDGQIDDLLSAVEQGGQVLIDGTQGRKTMELIAAVYQSATLGNPVSIPMQPEDPFYTRQGMLAHCKPFYKKRHSVSNFSDQRITISGDDESNR